MAKHRPDQSPLSLHFSVFLAGSDISRVGFHPYRVTLDTGRRTLNWRM